MIDLKFITGKISYDDLSSLENVDLFCQVDALKEDMLQVEYSVSLMLDVGWFPSFDKDGCFQVRVIKNQDWSAPVVFSKACTIELLIKELISAQEVIKRIT